jgi:hypothetical protein
MTFDQALAKLAAQMEDGGDWWLRKLETEYAVSEMDPDQQVELLADARAQWERVTAERLQQLREEFSPERLRLLLENG